MGNISLTERSNLENSSNKHFPGKEEKIFPIQEMKRIPALSSQPKLPENYESSFPKQLEMFSVQKYGIIYSNTIALYDTAPKFARYRNRIPAEDAKNLKFTKKTFTYLDPVVHESKRETYHITITPALLEKPEGIYFLFPGTREELVEDVLRKLVADGRGVFLDKQVGVFFSLYEVQQELKKRKHTYSISEIREAILVMGCATLSFEDEGKKLAEPSPFFSRVQLRTSKDKNGKCCVIFHPLVTKCVNERTFRLFNYEKSMELDTLGRYLLKRLSHHFLQADEKNTYKILLSTVIQGAGFSNKTRIRRYIELVMKSLQNLIQIEALKKYEIQKILERNKIVDARLVLTSGKPLISDIIKGNIRTEEIREKENREHSEKLLRSLPQFKLRNF